jgi:hypothetical protein
MICELDIVLGRDKRHGLIDRTLLVLFERLERKGQRNLRSKAKGRGALR